MRRPLVFSTGTAVGGAQCVRIGPLHEFVKRLDEDAEARPLHHLVGQLHMAGGDDEARRRWLGEVQQFFAAEEVACFDGDVDGPRACHIVAQSAQGADGPAVDAMLSSLRQLAPGEAVIFSSSANAGIAYARRAVCGAALRDDASRVIGLVVAGPRHPTRQSNALAKQLAAMVWHMHCADSAAGHARAVSRGLSSSELVALLPMPCVMVDAAGRVLERNEEFTEFMESVALHIATGRLRFEDPYLQDSWQVALAEVDATVVRQSLLVSEPDGRQWCVHLVPVHCRLDTESALERQTILAIAEQKPVDGTVALETALAEVSRPLTPAESDVLASLLQGFTAKVIAKSRGASVNTVRSQIMAILDKTGHHNQKSLIAAFGNSTFGASTNHGPSSSRPLTLGSLASIRRKR